MRYPPDVLGTAMFGGVGLLIVGGVSGRLVGFGAALLLLSALALVVAGSLASTMSRLGGDAGWSSRRVAATATAAGVAGVIATVVGADSGWLQVPVLLSAIAGRNGRPPGARTWRESALDRSSAP